MSTPLARDLLLAARGDRPDAARRSRIWDAVASAPEVSIAAAGTGAAVAGASAGKSLGLSAGKLLLLGALAGSLATAGVGSWLVAPGHETAHETGHETARRSEVVSLGVSPVAVAVSPDPRAATMAFTREEPSASPSASPAVASEPQAEVTPPVARRQIASPPAVRVATPLSREDALMREAALVSEARTLIVAGQASSALELLDAATKGTSHSLEPETLSLRARALRGLGREADAEQAEEALRHKYPDHFLAR